MLMMFWLPLLLVVLVLWWLAIELPEMMIALGIVLIAALIFGPT